MVRSGVGSQVSDRRERRLAVPSSQNDALSHALAMVVAPLCMGLFGAWLDNLLGTGWILAALFTTMGVIGAFVSAYYRYEDQIAQHDAGKPWTRRRTRGDGSAS
jgi:positive regulator of sigma E activity